MGRLQRGGSAHQKVAFQGVAWILLVLRERGGRRVFPEGLAARVRLAGFGRRRVGLRFRLSFCLAEMGRDNREIGSPTADRLVLRPWRDEDLVPFSALNADPEVMRWLGGPQPAERSDALADRIRREMGPLGLWAVELPGASPFIGFVGLQEPGFDADFTPCVEVGWRLARAYWGFGYASEAAMASLDYGFEIIGLDEVVSFTVVQNVRSRRVMERIGMREAGEFDHPSLPRGHELERHVLYRIDRGDWRRWRPAPNDL